MTGNREMAGSQPPFSTFNAQDPVFPVLISVPHAGRNYPADLLENSRISPNELIKLEDRYSDLLSTAVQKSGFATIIAHRPRAYMDLNRAPDDLDREMLSDIGKGAIFSVSSKQRGGLGLIPYRLARSGVIWKKRISHDEAKRRVETFHIPYHAAIERILRQMQARFGSAALLDLHSMPPIKSLRRESAPRFVVGDRFGGSAASRFAELLRFAVEDAGHACALNHPYPGDYMLRRHGRPQRGIHALQLEVCRSLYLDENLREPTDQAQVIALIIESLAFLLADALDPSAAALAAE